MPVQPVPRPTGCQYPYIQPLAPAYGTPGPVVITTSGSVSQGPVPDPCSPAIGGSSSIPVPIPRLATRSQAPLSPLCPGRSKCRAVVHILSVPARMLPQTWKKTNIIDSGTILPDTLKHRVFPVIIGQNWSESARIGQILPCIWPSTPCHGLAGLPVPLDLHPPVPGGLITMALETQ